MGCSATRAIGATANAILDDANTAPQSVTLLGVGW